jgi:SAM-dependent methyltransferase
VPPERQPHSAEQFGAQRDFWWRRDFLDLMAARWRLQEASSLADIGCGLCHWSRLLYPYLRQPARFAGVDREPRWVAEAPTHFRCAFPQVPAGLLTFHEAEATAIPFPDGTFDVVTCQTVLMHLARPLDALREMMRILRPGGLLLCAEPNNLWNYLTFTSLTPDEPVDVLVRRFEFWLRYHRGKQAMGQGDHTIGDLLPGHFANLGLSEIEVYQSDRTAALFPPYATLEQQALIQFDREWHDDLSTASKQAGLREQVLRGGGTAELFDQVFDELMNKHAKEQQAIAAGNFHSAGGALSYLVSGRKPHEALSA